MLADCSSKQESTNPNESSDDTILYDATAIIENNFLQCYNFSEELLEVKTNACHVTLNESVGMRDEDGGLWSLRCFTKITKFILSKKYLEQLLDQEDNSLLKDIFKMDKKYLQFCLKLYTHLPKWQNVQAFANKISLHMSEAELDDMYKILKVNQCVITGKFLYQYLLILISFNPFLNDYQVLFLICLLNKII